MTGGEALVAELTARAAAGSYCALEVPRRPLNDGLGFSLYGEQKHMDLKLTLPQP